jgi:hypothetical protein
MGYWLLAISFWQVKASAARRGYKLASLVRWLEAAHDSRLMPHAYFYTSAFPTVTPASADHSFRTTGVTVSGSPLV